MTCCLFGCCTVIKQEQTQPAEQENANAEVKEENNEHKLPAFDNRVSTITTIVKSESREADTTKNAVSVVMAPGVTVTKQEMSKEEERAVVRSNQQAKIPLKKRELKLADSYQSNHLNNNSSSSIIVCNPSVIQSKDAHGREGGLPNPPAPPVGPTASQQPQQQQQQQPVVTVSRLELTNGRASVLPPHKGGQNGVIGVVGHVGVICSPSERHRAPDAEQHEPNGPSLERRGCRAVEEEREVSRQSVLVRKGPVEGETAAAATAPPPPHTAVDAQAARKLPEAIEGKVDSVSASSPPQSTPEPQKQMTEDQSKKTAEEQLDMGTKTVHSSHQQTDGDPDSREEGGRESDHERNKSTLGKLEADSGTTTPPLRVDQKDKTDQQDHWGDGLNGGLSSQEKVKDTGSAERQRPLEEASSELQKEGIRLKIKIPPHRRNKLRGKGGKEEERDREQEVQEVQEEGKALRRSARICRYVHQTILEAGGSENELCVCLRSSCFNNFSRICTFFLEDHLLCQPAGRVRRLPRARKRNHRGNRHCPPDHEETTKSQRKTTKTRGSRVQRQRKREKHNPLDKLGNER